MFTRLLKYCFNNNYKQSYQFYFAVNKQKFNIYVLTSITVIDALQYFFIVLCLTENVHLNNLCE